MGKKGESVKKGVETIYKIALNKSFHKDVKNIRMEVGIPEEGFLNESQDRDYSRQRPTSTLIQVMELIKKYHLPMIYYWELQQYVRYGSFDKERGEYFSVKYPNDKKGIADAIQSYEKFQQPHVAIFIHEASSKEKLKSYIDKHWQQIRQSLKVQGVKDLRIRTTKNKERNLLIVELCAKQKDELCKIGNIDQAQCKMMSKEAVATRIMRNYYGFKTTTDEIVKKFGMRSSPFEATDKSQVNRRSRFKKK